MKRKILCILLAATMVAGSLAGCGEKNKSDEKKETAEDTKAAGEDSPKEEKTVLKLMAVGGANEQAFTDTIGLAADQFNKSNEYNAEIELEWYENEQYKTKLATLMTQNDVTDIFFTWEAGFMQDYVDSGKVYPLTDDLSADTEWKERFNEGAFDAVTYDDQIYAVPMGQAIIPVYYNKAMFAEAQVEEPKTWDEFMNIIQVFRDKGIIPVSMACQDAWVAGQMMLELSGGVAGKGLFNDIVAGNTTWGDERYVETGKAFQELVDAGAFPENFLGLGYDEGRSLFTTGKAAMYPMGTWDTSAVIEGMGGAENVGVFMQPVKTAENEGVHISTVEKLFAVSEKCENKEAAVAFIKMLSNPDIQEKFVVDCGSLPATKVEIGTDKVDSVTAEIMELQTQVKTALTPMDRQFGANVGGEFNNISLAIAGGKDAAQQFGALEAYAKQESEQ